MKYLQIIIVLSLFFLISCSGNKNLMDSENMKALVDRQAGAYNSSEFVLGIGDEVTIQVWRNDDLERKLLIDPSGNIYLPLAGKIKAAGLSLSQLREEVTVRLSRYIINPQVDINLLTITSQRFIVLGEVKSPGSFALNQTVSALEAIATAGGYTDDANQKNILLVRTDEDIAQVIVLNLNIKELNKDAEFDLMVNLQQGDIVYVLPSFVANVEQFMVRLNNILKPFLTTAQTIWFGDRAIDIIVNSPSE